MNLRSAFSSSAIEILYSKKLIALMYFVLASLILTHMILASVQFIDAYYVLGEFDISPLGFYAVTAFFFLPLWLISALIFRALIQRIRLLVWTKQMPIIPEYKIGLSPAEAGYLVDFEYNRRELVATLLDLWFRGAIDITIQNDNKARLSKANVNATKNDYEHWLIKWIFSSNNEIIVSSFSDRRLVNAASKAHKKLVNEFSVLHLTPTEKHGRAKLNKVFKAIYGVGGSIGVLATISFIVDPGGTLGINYPRYSVEPGQLVALAGCGLVFITVVTSGFWPKYDANWKTAGSQIWLRAAGSQLYERVVYIDRHSNHFADSNSSKLLKSYIAYAIVFGIYEVDDMQVKQLIKLLSG